MHFNTTSGECIIDTDCNQTEICKHGRCVIGKLYYTLRYFNFSRRGLTIECIFNNNLGNCKNDTDCNKPEICEHGRCVKGKLHYILCCV